MHDTMAGNVMVLEDEKVPVTRDQVLGVALQSAGEHHVVLRVAYGVHVQVLAPEEVPKATNGRDHAGGLADAHAKIGSQQHIE
jgi:hypothetical protein